MTITDAHLSAARDAHVKMVDTFGEWSPQAMHAEGIVDTLAWILGKGAPYGILSDVDALSDSDAALMMLRQKLTNS